LHRRAGGGQRVVNRLRHLRGVAFCHDVHVHHARRFADEMIVQGALLDAALLEFCHHRRDFVGREHEIAHRDRLAVRGSLERDPRSERECRLEGDVPDSDAKIAARKAELVDAPRLIRTRPAKGTIGCAPIGRGLSVYASRRQDQDPSHCADAESRTRLHKGSLQ
jgi:hypothetical protein